MAIESYDDLKDNVADWLLRDDLTDVIPTFIANAEAGFNRGVTIDGTLYRLRDLVSTTLTIDSEEEDLPDNFLEIESLSITGSSNNGELDTVSPGILPSYVRIFGTSGIPQAVAVLGSQFRFAPTPDESYAFDLSYWRGVPTLSDTLQSNWLLASHPDIYLYGALVESAPYLRDDPRMALWISQRNQRIVEFAQSLEAKRWSGTLTRRPARHIP